MNTTTTENLLKKVGLKTTSARKAVLEIINDHSSPIDISHLIKDLGKKKVSADQATIYRIIENFYEKGLVARIQFQDNKFRYEAARGDHHHAICKNCGRIEDILDCSVEKIEKQITDKKGFTVMSHSLEFFGICKNCKTKRS